MALTATNDIKIVPVLNLLGRAIYLFLIIHATMIVTQFHGDCAVKPLGRLSFQPLSDMLRVVSAYAALFGLLGMMLYGLIRNWKRYTEKLAAHKWDRPVLRGVSLGILMIVLHKVGSIWLDKHVSHIVIMVLLFLYTVYTYYSIINPLVQQEDGQEDQNPHGIPVFVRPQGGEEVFIQNITNILGYTSLARNIQDLSQPSGLNFPLVVLPQRHSPHVLWPWSNFHVDYDCLWDQGRDLMLYGALDPLGLDKWSDFIGGLSRIVLEEDDDGLKIPILRPQNPNPDCFLLRKYLVGNRIKFYRMLQLALYGYENIEPPEQLWNGEGVPARIEIAPEGVLFTFYDQQEQELVPHNLDWLDFEADLSYIVIRND